MRKILFFILYFFFSIVYGQNILVENSDHVITYTISGEMLKIMIYDLKDNENNTCMNNELGRGYRYEGYKLQKLYGNYANLDKDIALLEIDFNRNGNFEKGVDKGYFLGQKRDKVNAHELGDFYAYPPKRFSGKSYSDGSEGILWIKDSKATAKAQWFSSKFSSVERPIYEFNLPIAEVMEPNTKKVDLRFVLYRVASNWKAGVDYKAFTYPEHQPLPYKDGENKTLTIDLSDSNSAEVKKLHNAFKQRQEQQLIRKIEGTMYSKLATSQANKKATIKLPTNDGLYIKLKNGKYIEVPKNIPAKGVLWSKQKMNPFNMQVKVNRDKRPYWTDDAFDTLNIIRIKKNDFLNYSIVAGNELKSVVDLSKSIFLIEKVTLRPYGINYLVSEATNSREMFGDVVRDTDVYFAQKEILVERQTGTSWSYGYTVTEVLEAGYYCVWAGSFVWAFQLID